MIKIIEQNDDDKRKMYSEISKENLIEMLIECNKIISKMSPIVTSSGLEYEIKEHTVNYTQGFNGLKVLPEPE